MVNYSFDDSEINRKLKKIVRRVKPLHLKYQNTILLLLSFAFTYYFVKTGMVESAVEFLGNFGYVSAVVLGFFFAFGFTTTIAAATLVFLAKIINPVTMAFLGALGATISNLLVYLFVKHKLLNEIKSILSEDFKIEFSKFEIRLGQSLTKKWWMKILVPALAGILTALPVPTEFIAAILWNIVKYRIELIVFFTFIFSFLGILALGLFGASL